MRDAASTNTTEMSGGVGGGVGGVGVDTEPHQKTPQQRTANVRTPMVIPEEVRSLCPEEFEDLCLLEDLTMRIDDAIRFNQSMLMESHSYFSQDTNWLQKPLPSWTLRLEGFVVDPPNSSISFTSLFDKIIVIWNKETLIWDKMSSKMEMVSSQGGDPLPLECSGFELSAEMTQLLGAHHASLALVTRILWEHIQQNNLLKRPQCKSATADVVLAKLLKVMPGTEVPLSSLPNYLKHHLLPLRPITITHRLRLRNNQDVLNSHKRYDFLVESPNLLHYNDSQLWSKECKNADDSKLTASNELAAQAEKLDAEISDMMADLKTCIRRHIYFQTMSEKPTKFIDALLRGSFPGCPMGNGTGVGNLLKNNKMCSISGGDAQTGDEEELVDGDDFVDACHLDNQKSNLFYKPWVQFGVRRYLDNQTEPLSDQIKKYAVAVESERTLVRDYINSNISPMPSFRAKRPRRQDRPMPSYVNKPFSFPYGTSPFGALPSPTSQAQRQFHYPPYFGGPSSSMPMTRFPMAFTRGAMLQVPQPSNLNPSSSPNVLSGGLHTSQPISPRPPFPFVTPASTIGNAGVPPNLSSSTNTVPQQQRVQNFSEGHLQNLT